MKLKHLCLLNLILISSYTWIHAYYKYISLTITRLHIVCFWQIQATLVLSRESYTKYSVENTLNQRKTKKPQQPSARIIDIICYWVLVCKFHKLNDQMTKTDPSSVKNRFRKLNNSLRLSHTWILTNEIIQPHYVVNNWVDEWMSELNFTGQE